MYPDCLGDPSMQVSRPDGKPDFLGLKVLDEPAAIQSDPSVLTMQLRQASKQVGTPHQHAEATCHRRYLCAVWAGGRFLL